VSHAAHHIRDWNPGRFFQRVSPVVRHTPSVAQRRTSYHVAPAEASHVMHSEHPQAAFCLVAEQVVPDRSNRGGVPHAGTEAWDGANSARASTMSGACRAMSLGVFIEGMFQHSKREARIRFTRDSRSFTCLVRCPWVCRGFPA
jgi:hypothetical protein